MSDVFLKYLEGKIIWTNEDFAMIKLVSVIKYLRKKRYLLQEGDIWQFNAFVCRGFLRTYSVDNKGQQQVQVSES